MSSQTTAAPTQEPFVAGAIVMITLSAPREKFWGSVLSITAAGTSIRGIDLNSFEDFIYQVKAGEPAYPHTVFFPMHRIDRIELDDRDGDIPSMQERFTNKCGISFSDLLSGTRIPAVEPGA